MKNIYISGPVSGRMPEEASGHFKANEQRIRDAAGECKIEADTYSPVRFCKPEYNWKQAMRVCIEILSCCDGIAMLQGWQHSRGA